ncbi:MAG: DUF952 domain-containing protein [Polyangiales bacterium]
MRWIYHLTLRPAPAADPYAPPSLAAEGFVHGSYRDAVRESARLYFPPDADLVALQLDPRVLGDLVRVASTPRGPMPHVHGAIPAAAIRAALSLEAMEGAPDEVEEG